MRLFIGIAFENGIQNKLIQVQEEASELIADGRFFNPGNFHLTLRFIGEISEETIPKIQEAMVDTAKEVAPFEIVINRLGRFQKRNRNILWLGTQSSSVLENLHKNLNTQLENKIGLEPTLRPFTPHVTLGRNIQMREDWADFKQKISVPDISIKVSAITLFQSTRVEGELRYLPVEVVRLNNMTQN